MYNYAKTETEKLETMWSSRIFSISVTTVKKETYSFHQALENLTTFKIYKCKMNKNENRYFLLFLPYLSETILIKMQKTKYLLSFNNKF